MNDGFVADASVAVAWVHPAQATQQTRLLLQAVYDGAPVEVPAIWPLEISNALLVLVRRKKLFEAERQAALAALQRVAVKIDHEMSSLAFTKLSAIASEYQLSVYDAAYLELAQRRKLPLACKDGPLREAATRANIKVLLEKIPDALILSPKPLNRRIYHARPKPKSPRQNHPLCGRGLGAAAAGGAGEKTPHDLSCG